MSNKTVSTLRASSSTVSSRCNAILARGDGPVLTCFICLEEGVLWNTTCTSNDVSTNAASCTSTATCDEVNSKGADTIVVQKKDLREASGSSTMMTAVMVTAFNVGAEHTSDSDEDDKDDQINYPRGGCGDYNGGGGGAATGAADTGGGGGAADTAATGGGGGSAAAEEQYYGNSYYHEEAQQRQRAHQPELRMQSDVISQAQRNVVVELQCYSSSGMHVIPTAATGDHNECTVDCTTNNICSTNDTLNSNHTDDTINSSTVVCRGDSNNDSHYRRRKHNNTYTHEQQQPHQMQQPQQVQKVEEDYKQKLDKQQRRQHKRQRRRHLEQQQLSSLVKGNAPTTSDGTAGRGRQDLVPCCTQCFAVVHPHCWAEWRDCQKFATLRAQLLSYNRPNPVNCCICKTGFARVENDDGSCCYPFSETTQGQRRLQDELFSIIRRMLTQDSYANGEEEPPLCTPISAALAMLFVLVVGLVDLYLIAVPRAYPGHVLLVTLLLCHIVAVAFFFVLAILQRNQALGMLRMRPEDGDSDSSSIVGDTAVLEEDDDVLPPAPYHCRGNDDTATATGRRGATAVNRATGGLTEILLSIEC
eukprot:Lankesteria_metandrocarpae@DN2448_c0_g1_i2.p1